MSDRRKQIRRSIRGFKAQSKRSSDAKANPAAAILAGLNALQTLQDAAGIYLRDVVWFGANSYAGEGWASALLWYRPQGLNQHRTMTLFGVWVVQAAPAAGADTAAPARIIIGSKPLTYSAPVYNPESYHQLIRRDFTTYYGDDGCPPDANYIFAEMLYDPANRLGLRREIGQEIERWMRR